MQYIDERFKERAPEETVKIIQDILQKNGIEVVEKWTDSGIENCFSLSLQAKCGVPSSNGKGITKDLARASAYGEFIERLQGGLFFYKYQSIGKNKNFDLQSFAPDVKYMTAEELKENGEWMDYLISEYNNPLITKDSLTDICKTLDNSSDGKILTVPFYSLFEDKYVYLPMGFVDQVYATNGCCVGNTKQEAWVHALSEILERHASISTLLSGKPAPKLSPDIIKQYKTVSKIIDSIHENGEFEIDIFDYSGETGFPVVSTRIINKTTHSYHVNVAADPVLEIALQRTLTESFQGKNIKNITSKSNGKILGKVSDFPVTSNVTNQLETSNGIYTADYFANELNCSESRTVFPDNSNKNNSELLDYVLNIFKKIGKPVYVRNFSYLGFPCYRFVVPGYSEALAVKLADSTNEFAFAKEVCNYLRTPTQATDFDLIMVMTYYKMISNTLGRSNFFGRVAGVPLVGEPNFLLSCVTKAYVYHRMKNYSDAASALDVYLKSDKGDKDIKEYFSIIIKYLELKEMGIAKDKIRSVLNKFFCKKEFDRLYDKLDNGKSPYDDFLLNCADFDNCENCKYSSYCAYHDAEKINVAAGNVYKAFTHGQDRNEFVF